MHPRQLIQPDPGWLDSPTPARVARVALMAASGLALYGFTVGFWRAPMMGAFVAVKLPLLVALTLVSNGLLNGLLAALLGTGLGFRQSLLALLTSFAIAGVILGSLAPVTLLLAYNAPEPTSPSAATAHSVYLVSHTFLIGFAGVAANLHLHRLLARHAPDRRAATTTLLAWLGGNCLLGTQFAWILRPFFGTPTLKIQFLREHPMHGNFFESLWNALTRFSGNLGGGLLLFAVLLILAASVFQTIRPTTPKQNKP